MKTILALLLISAAMSLAAWTVIDRLIIDISILQYLLIEIVVLLSYKLYIYLSQKYLVSRSEGQTQETE